MDMIITVGGIILGAVDVLGGTMLLSFDEPIFKYAGAGVILVSLFIVVMLVIS